MDRQGRHWAGEVALKKIERRPPNRHSHTRCTASNGSSIMGYWLSFPVCLRKPHRRVKLVRNGFVWLLIVTTRFCISGTTSASMLSSASSDENLLSPSLLRAVFVIIRVVLMGSPSADPSGQPSVAPRTLKWATLASVNALVLNLREQLCFGVNSAIGMRSA